MRVFHFTYTPDDHSKLSLFKFNLLFPRTQVLIYDCRSRDRPCSVCYYNNLRKLHCLKRSLLSFGFDQLKYVETIVPAIFCPVDELIIDDDDDEEEEDDEDDDDDGNDDDDDDDDDDDEEEEEMMR